jgi:glycosyltransferase involved in cell wall biosynthesis
MNAMPMMYALELRQRGYEIVYLVDVPRANQLSRPEHHFEQIQYPYPNWVVEFVIPSQILASLFPRTMAGLVKRVVRRATRRNIGCYILNGYFISLGPYLGGSADLVALSHGSDLDVWANEDGAEVLADAFRNRSIFKYMPTALAKWCIRLIVRRQFRALTKMSAVMYFPRGFNHEGDRVLDRLAEKGVRHVPRYDISFEPLKGQPRDLREGAESSTIEVFSGVRFLFETFPDGNKGYCKGNDVIIRGLGRYYKEHKDIRVHFVEKGEDVARAKELCREHGLESAVIWHKEMPLRELLRLYIASDICFDQVGPNWIGAIGGYALYLGRPLIANPGPAVKAGIWPADNPICAASSEHEIYEWLLRLRDPMVRRHIAEKSKAFVEEFMGPNKALNELFTLPIA